MNRGGAGKMKGRRNRRTRSESPVHAAWRRTMEHVVPSWYVALDLVSRDLSK